MPYISKRIVSQSRKDKQFYRQFEKPKLSFNAACIKSIKFLERIGRQGKRIAAAADDYEKNYIFACRRDLHVGLRIVVACAERWRSITKGDWVYKKKSQERVTCKSSAMWKIVFPTLFGADGKENREN